MTYFGTGGEGGGGCNTDLFSSHSALMSESYTVWPEIVVVQILVILPPNIDFPMANQGSSTVHGTRVFQSFSTKEESYTVWPEIVVEQILAILPPNIDFPMANQGSFRPPSYQ